MITFRRHAVTRSRLTSKSPISACLRAAGGLVKEDAGQWPDSGSPAAGGQIAAGDGPFSQQIAAGYMTTRIRLDIVGGQDERALVTGVGRSEMSPDIPDDADTVEMTPPAGPVSWGEAATRRMCAGVYLDREFRDQVLRSVYCDWRRRVAPSYGFDLVVVSAHAWRAWRLDLAQHLIVLTVLVVALSEAPLDSLIAASALAIWHLGGGLLRIAIGISAYYRGQKTFLEFERLKSRGDLMVRAILGSCLVFAAAVVAAWHMSSRRRGVPEPWPDRTGLTGAVVIILIAVGVVAMISAARQIKLTRLRRHDAAPVRAVRRRMAAIDAQQGHPFTVYSGFRPFIGSGVEVRTWSFAQRLIHHKPTGSEDDQEYGSDLPFTAKELVARLKEMIERLRNDDNAETRLPGLTVTDHVFVEGSHADPYRQVLDTRDGTGAEDAIAKAISDSSSVARHYIACQVESWGGEVVTSVFVHVSLQGRTLYLEFSTYALLPTRQEYHVIDEIGWTGPASVVRAAGKGLTHVSDAVLAPRRLAQVPGELWAAMRAQGDGTAKVRRSVNIGAEVSAREAAAAGSDESYFQVRDVLQHSKIIERRLIATVGAFLKERGVDTTEFLARANTILNNGVINAGPGTVNIAGSAIGDQASVSNESRADGGTAAS
jgi:hypothetical protein